MHLRGEGLNGVVEPVSHLHLGFVFGVHLRGPRQGSRAKRKGRLAWRRRGFAQHTPRDRVPRLREAQELFRRTFAAWPKPSFEKAFVLVSFSHTCKQRRRQRFRQRQEQEPRTQGAAENKEAAQRLCAVPSMLSVGFWSGPGAVGKAGGLTLNRSISRSICFRASSNGFLSLMSLLAALQRKHGSTSGGELPRRTTVTASRPKPRAGSTLRGGTRRAGTHHVLIWSL